MTSECSLNQQRIPRSFVGDLAAEEQQSLDAHLAACPFCRTEHDRVAETLSVLQSAGDEPVPRHFFVYPKDPAWNPWQLFRQMIPGWQVATACVVCLLLFLSAANVMGIQVQRDTGGWALTFGGSRALSGSDIAALKADILRSTEETNREIALRYIQSLRAEMNGVLADLGQQQQNQLVAALDRLETRVNNRIVATADELKAGSQNSAASLYQTVSLQRAQDINAVNARLDKVTDNAEVKARQTDEILETLLQIANLNLKQPGDQK